MLRFIIVILFAIIFFRDAEAQDKVMQKDEELTYTVYFGFIKLGEVNIELKNSFLEDGIKFHSAKAVLKSYEGIPFLAVHYIFESLMRTEKNGVTAMEFHSTDYKENAGEKMKVNTDYYFEYDSSFIRVKKYSDPNKPMELDYAEQIEKGRLYQDGLSVFFNARLNSLNKGAGSNKILDVFINEKKSTVKYSFDFNRTALSGSLVDYDVAVFKIAGVADFKGVLGLNGEFEAYISDDAERVPIKAKFNIMIGSVNLELTKFKRTGWLPPKFDDT